MKPHTLTPYPMTPPDAPPDMTVEGALLCFCGGEPVVHHNAHNTGKVRLECPKCGHEGALRWSANSALEHWNAEMESMGQDLKEEGQELVAHNNEAWMEFAQRTIAALADSGRPFTVTDVRLGCFEPSHPNAWGAAFSRAAKQGLIERVGYMKNHLASAHGRIVSTWLGALWRSKVWLGLLWLNL